MGKSARLTQQFRSASDKLVALVQLRKKVHAVHFFTFFYLRKPVKVLPMIIIKDYL